jgi:hypothetical protein
MKYVYSIIINYIVKNLKGITFPIKTDEQILISVLSFGSLKPTVISGSVKSPANIVFTHAMLKSGGIELYGNVHVLIYYISRSMYNIVDHKRRKLGMRNGGKIWAGNGE